MRALISRHLVFLVIVTLLSFACGDDTNSSNNLTFPDTGDTGTVNGSDISTGNDTVTPTDTPAGDTTIPGDTAPSDTVVADVCTPDCDGKSCGDDGCGGSCGDCPEGSVCIPDDWVCGNVNPPDCEGKECGPDGVGGSCGECGDQDSCSPEGKCVVQPQCGEVTKIGCCEFDLLWVCDDGAVTTTDCNSSPHCGWNGAIGGYDCGTDGDEAPGGLFPIDCPWVCHPACDGKNCGPDGCGDVCGLCDEAGSCNDGVCCNPDCEGKDCGGDGCGGTCGSCAASEICSSEGTCNSACLANCEGKECGLDGCGGVCGQCPTELFCTDFGNCVEECEPNCEDKECGSNGCGNICGTCANDEFCSPAGLCTDECLPDCDGKSCGPDGCGGQCGLCEAGIACTVGGQCGNSCLDCSFPPSCLAFGFESGNLLGWSLSGDAKVVNHLGETGAFEGEKMLDLSNALASEGKVIIQTCVPEGTTGIRFMWKLYSEEFLEWCGTAFQDSFRVTVHILGETDGPVAVFERSISQLCPSSTCPTCGEYEVPIIPADVGFDNGDVHMTQWLGNTLNLSDLIGGESTSLHIEFAVGDVGDSIFDTHVLLDAVELLSTCVPECGDNLCGDDGCGGVCGQCFGDIACTNGNCCTPECEEQTCGDDGCGGICGTCGEGETCNDGGCCELQCEGKNCGVDGCGGSCGTCTQGDLCVSGECTEENDVFGSPCDDDADCGGEGFLCFDPFFSPQICTRPCQFTSPGDCPEGWWCVPVPGSAAGPVCAPL